MAIDPKDPNRLFVAVLGHPYGPNEQRGLYRTLDGGATFSRVLYKDENAGAFDVAIDPADPKIVYATLWAARQAPWEIGSSFEIPGSGIFKSSDGGTNWTPLTEGLPPRIGRAEVAVAPSNSNVIYAYADAEKKGDEAGALYRSDDGGSHFALVNREDEIAQRGDDLVSLAVDPRNPQTVYLTNTSTYRSTDGGKTMVAIKGAPGGDDYHNVWINPEQSGDRRARERSRRGDQRGRRRNVELLVQSADRADVSRERRQPLSVLGLRRSAGERLGVRRSAAATGDESRERDWHTVGAQEYGYVVPDPQHPGVLRSAERSKNSTSEPIKRNKFRRSRCRPNAIESCAPSRSRSTTSTGTGSISARTSSLQPRTAAKAGARSARI